MPLLNSDVANLEWRTLLELSGDKIGIQEILDGLDTHTDNQNRFGLPSRLIAKVFLFRWIYRGSAYAYANDPDFSHVSSSADYWDGVNEKFFKKYSGINECHFKWKERCEQGLPIVSPFGREWDIPLLNSYGKVNWTQFTNYPVQGTSGDVIKIAMVYIRKRIKDLPVYLINTVHDSIILDGRDETSCIQAGKICYGTFQEIPDLMYKHFGWRMPIPITGEIEIGERWSEVKEIKY